MKLTLVNLTPHTINLRCPQTGNETVVESSGLARVSSTNGAELDMGPDAPCAFHRAPTWGKVEGLPEPTPGTLYIVSALVAGQCMGRTDVFSPGTGPKDGAVRNDKGHIVAVTRLNRAPQPDVPRVCNCGSGQPWAYCDAASPYCG